MTQKSRNDWPINADKASRVKILFILYKFLYICTYILVTDDQLCKQSATKQQQLHNVAFRKAYSLKWLCNKRATRVQSVASLCLEIIQYSIVSPSAPLFWIIVDENKINGCVVQYVLWPPCIQWHDVKWNLLWIVPSGWAEREMCTFTTIHLWDLTFGNSFTHIASWNLSWHFFFFFWLIHSVFPKSIEFKDCVTHTV